MKIYMIGIGGIGMSALAQLYCVRGDSVSGSDREASPTTELLEEKGIRVFIGQSAEHVPQDADLAIFSDAVWEDNPERVRVRKLGIRELSYFEALGEVSQHMRTVAVAGSHGKTTTTGMLAKILADAGEKPTAIVGSIVQDFGSNFLPGREGLLIVEACEYKDHVLKLSPEILVITNLEWDHTDYFKDFEQLKETFRTAIRKLPAGGALIIDASLPLMQELAQHAPCRVVDYSRETVPGLLLLGGFNEQNARAAKAAARITAPSVREEVFDASLASFKGSWRRFEYIGVMKKGAVVYDDYAHHPTEIRATLDAMRAKFPRRKLIVAFHPHLYTRTRDLMGDFVEALRAADECLIAPIYAAREEPIPGVTSDALAKKLAQSGTPARGLRTLEETEGALRAFDSPETIVVTMGAGDIYKIAKKLVA